MQRLDKFVSAVLEFNYSRSDFSCGLIKTQMVEWGADLERDICRSDKWACQKMGRAERFLIGERSFLLANHS